MGPPPPERRRRQIKSHATRRGEDAHEIENAKPRTGSGSALAVSAFLPELAHAQQTGLFPLAPIRRQRPPCDQEDPAYKMYQGEIFRPSSHGVAEIPGWLGHQEQRRP